MEISLNSNFDKFINEQIASGLYKSAGDIVSEAMTLLMLRKSVSSERINAFNAEVKKGMDDIDEGRFSDGDDFFKKLIKEYE